MGRRAWREHLAGWRDGRRGMPVLGSDGDGVELVQTAHMLSVWSQADERLGTEYARLLERTRADRTEYRQHEPRIAHLKTSLAEFQERLRVAEAAGPESGRRMGEHLLPDDQVQRRRRREFERRLRYLRKEIAERRNELTALEARRLQLEEQMEAALREARASGQRALGTAHRRIATYLKGACRTHPDAAALAHAVDPLRPSRPGWLELNSARDLMTTTEDDE